MTARAVAVSSTDGEGRPASPASERDRASASGSGAAERAEAVEPGSARRSEGPILVIQNPNAGRGPPAALRRRLEAAFAAEGVPFQLVQTEAPGHAVELAREAARGGHRAVCVVGGDGTLAEAAAGLVGTKVPLAVVPRGTGNQVAKNLGIPLRLAAAVRVAARGEPRVVDLGDAEGRPFALLAGAGFDALVMTRATRELKERWGFSAYLYAAVTQALAATPARFRLTADGETREFDAVSVMVANVGALFAKGLPVRLPLTPHAGDAWSDGLFDVLVIAPRGIPDWAGLLWAASRGRFGPGGRLVHLQARAVTIEADRSFPTQIDGDVVGRTPLSARVLPGALRILVSPRPGSRPPTR